MFKRNWSSSCVFFIFENMELRFTKASEYTKQVRYRLIAVTLAFWLFGGLLMKFTGNVIYPSVIIGWSSTFVIRWIQLSVPVKVRDGLLIQRTANLNWFSEVPLSKIKEVSYFEEKKPLLIGMVRPGQGLKIKYNTFDEEVVECLSASFIQMLREGAPEAKFIGLK